MAGMSFFLRTSARSLVVLALLCTAAGADEEQARNQVSFSVERSREVENDWVTAVIGATHESTDPADVAAKINTAVTWGMDQAKATQGVRVRTGGYTTRPISDPKRSELRRWRGTQTLVLEGADARVMSELVGRLQARLQLQDISFSVSPERRRSVEDELLDEALAAFRERAERVRAQLGAKGYAIVAIQLGSTGGPPPRPMRGAVMMADAVSPAPPLEGGTSTLRASAHATVELGF
jgi:predicted secreted protein